MRCHAHAEVCWYVFLLCDCTTEQLGFLEMSTGQEQKPAKLSETTKNHCQQQRTMLTVECHKQKDHTVSHSGPSPPVLASASGAPAAWLASCLLDPAIAQACTYDAIGM